MTREVLLIAPMDGVENCARMISDRLGTGVATASSRKDGLEVLREAAYSVVVVDESLVEGDPAWADTVWDEAGFASILQINFAISGAERLAREIKAALTRRAGEQAVARRAVVSELEDELKSSLTGLLLQSELALREPSMPASLAPKLQHVVELAGEIRERLRGRDQH